MPGTSTKTGGTSIPTATESASGGGGSGSIADITSSDATVTVTNPTGPTTNLKVPLATSSTPGNESAAQFNQLASTWGPWITVNVPTDTQDVILSAGLDGDADQAYQVDMVCAPTTQTSCSYFLRVGVDGGAASDTGCESLQILGNGAVVASINTGGFFLTDTGTVATGISPKAFCQLASLRTTFTRDFVMQGNRGPSANGALYYGKGQYAAAGNVTTLTLHASTSVGFKAGSLIRYRKIGS